MLYALGGAGGGLTCYVDDGFLCFEYNTFIVMRTKIRSDKKLPSGKAKIQVSTEYAEARPAGPLNITMTVNGDEFAPRHRAGQRAVGVLGQRLP